jgi:hypothetical protein
VIGTKKEISFNEFLKEGVLKPDLPVEQPLEFVKPGETGFKLPEKVPADEEAVKSGWRDLRSFFRTGKITGKNDPGPDLFPALLLPHFSGQEMTPSFPVFLPEKGTTAIMFVKDLIENKIAEIFEEGDAKILRANVSRIVKSFHESVTDNDGLCSFHSAYEKANNALLKLKIGGEERKDFEKDLIKFKAALPSSGTLLGYTPQSALHIVAHVLSGEVNSKRIDFLKKLIPLRKGLSDILAVEMEKEPGKDNLKNLDQSFSFADSIIEFDKLNNLMPESASEPISAKRKKRLTEVLSMINDSEERLMKHLSYIVIGEGIYKIAGIDWKAIFSDSQIQVAQKGHSCGLPTITGLKSWQL